ncbi:MAG: hypothetical protein HRU11_09970 [Parvularculaceae bacterium]|nr:hypothetical protein [Parvularculaceae bacterium]
MRQPLEDVLADDPERVRATSLAEAEDQLRSVFLAAQGQANAYSAERLQEVFEVAERALALSEAFPVPETHRAKSPAGAWWSRISGLASKYGVGLLLAACAPLVADSSVTLAIASGVGAVWSLAAARQADKGLALPKPPPPKVVEAKMRGLLSAADRSLLSMTAPRALEAPSKGRSDFQQEDVLHLMQDILALGRGDDANEDAIYAAQNSQRLLKRAGFAVVWDGSTELFEVMSDPSVSGEILLKPALEHNSEPTKTVFGVKVRGGGA